MSNQPSDKDRLIHEALTELGWDSDPGAVAEKVRRLEIGLPREDEFSVVCSWLGQCDLLHKLDQRQIPIKSRDEFQVPDIFALFNINGRRVPVLIEVKASTEKKLSLKPEYFCRLRNYAKLLNLPLLFAWKFHGVWVLFDAAHLKKTHKNFNIKLVDALKENLLGILAGDFSYTLGQGTGIHLRFRKDKLLREEEIEAGTSQEWATVIDQVLFADYTGALHENMDPQVQSLFTTWDLHEEEDHTEHHIYMRFVVKGDCALFAHMALVRLINWELPENQSINWRQVLAKDSPIKNIGNFSAAINLALKNKVVHHVIQQQPQTVPDFLVGVNG